VLLFFLFCFCSELLISSFRIFLTIKSLMVLVFIRVLLKTLFFPYVSLINLESREQIRIDKKWYLTYRSEDEERDGSFIFLHSWWFGWPSSKSVASVVVVFKAQETIWLWIQSIKVNRNCMKRMVHFDINKDWLGVSPEKNHSSISLTMVIHLMIIYMKLYLCVWARLVKK
jgi:hypothetical protein